MFDQHAIPGKPWILARRRATLRAMSEAPTAASETLAAGRTATADRYDELVTGQKAIRAHWQGLLSVIRSLPGGGFQDRVERARRQLQESGVMRRETWDGSASVAWSFEPLPLILTAADWQLLESGVRQRARLLELLLADMYGAQQLLPPHVLPPSLVHANEQFLRPCHVRDGAVPPKCFLTVYAADVARMPDGSWAVVADHTQAPPGAGYALFLRRTLARTMPEAFRATAVREIESFFTAWQAALRALAPEGVLNPKIALLTAGPYARTYFEQVFLARVLGIGLVEGGDLSVRGGRLTVKTLEGLNPIDVLLRRLEGAYCDPLELWPDSTLGVSGLAGATRSGTLAMANALGSGAAEIPALAPFLPGIADALLGEELHLPSVDAWWLGEAPALQQVRDKLEGMLVRPALAAGGDALPRAGLAERIRARPLDYVAQWPVEPSLAPAWSPDGLQPAPVVVRMFAVARGNDYVVMPGGLGHTPADPRLAGLGRLDGSLRDVWVLAEDSAEMVIPPPNRFQRVPINRGSDLQSRVADNLFWLGRYVERLDDAARLLRAAVSRLIVGPLGPRDLIELRLLGLALEAQSLIKRDDALAPPDGTIFASALAQSIGPAGMFHHCLLAIKRLTASTRDRLSADMVATLDELLGHTGRSLQIDQRDFDRLLAVLDDIVRFVATFSGFAQENVTRGVRWNFLDLGRRLERGHFTARGAMSPFQQTPIMWDAAMRLALELCDSALTYRNRYLGALEPAPTLDLVLLDDSNPRSLTFQLQAMDQHLAALGRITGVSVASPVPAMLEDIKSAVALFEADERAWRDDGLTLTQLRQSLDDTGRRLSGLSDELTRGYFSLLPAARRVGVSVA